MVVVTGATGHIGSVLVRELIQRGEKVSALVLPSDNLIAIKDLDLEIVRGDVRELETLVTAFQGAKKVYHLAGMVSIETGKKKLLEDINLKGTKNVIEACLQTGVDRLVYVSSIHAFSEPPPGIPIVETKTFDSSKLVGQYAKTKAAATMEVLIAVERGLDAVVVHPTGVIGPYEYKLSNTGQLIFDFMHGKLFAYLDGAYDFVDVRDVAKGIVLACEKGKRGENYILSGERIKIKELLTILEQETGVRAPKLKIPFWLAKLIGPLSELYYLLKKQQPLFTSYSITTLFSNSLTSNKKAVLELGYETRPIREAIKDTIRWFREHENIVQIKK